MEFNLEQKIILDQEQTIADAQALEDLKKTDGWKLLDKFLQEMLDNAMHNVVYSKDIDTIIRYQEIAKSCKMISSWMDVKIQAARAARPE